MKAFIVLAMIFCHIVDDYYLQGILKHMKQISWWEQNAPDPLYTHDYIVALLVHSFSWSFMILLPVAVWLSFQLDLVFILVFILNTVIHAIVDNLKANRKKINLIVDQSIHMTQILITAIVLL